MTAIANANVTVTVTPPSGSPPTTVTKTTDAQGKFTVSLPLVVVGSYGVKADYAGVPNQYQAASATITVTALAAAVPVTLTLASSAPSGTVGDTLTITATLTA